MLLGIWPTGSALSSSMKCNLHAGRRPGGHDALHVEAARAEDDLRFLAESGRRAR